MIDLHCHILPGLDDGPANVEESLALARDAAAAGTSRVVATPHVSERYSGTTALGIAMATLELNRHLTAAGIDLRVIKGAEVALSRAPMLADDELRRLRLGGGPWLLVECPTVTAGGAISAALQRIADRGVRVLLAHAERIPAFQQDPALLEELVAGGMLCQVTAASLAGRFGQAERGFAERLVGAGLVHVVASDAHSALHRRPCALPYLREGGWAESWIAWWTRDVPGALLAGDELPPPPVGPARREATPRSLKQRA